MPKATRVLPPAARGVMSRELVRSSLVRSGGFRVYADFPERRAWVAIRDEALAQWRSAGRYESTRVQGDWRIENAPMRLFTSPGGPALRAFYHSRRNLAILSEGVGRPVEPLPERTGSYSYYARAGDHLSLHRDVVGCDFAITMVLHDESSPEASGGSLVLYPGRWHEPLSAIRRTPGTGAVAMKLTPGHTVLLCGGIVPHAVLPVARGQHRIISALCYRFA